MVEERKIKYNYILNRYYNGCNYIEAHPDEFDKYFNKVMEFKRQLENLLTEIQKKQEVLEDEVLGGFKIC